MASLFLNPPSSSSSLSVLKKNPTSTTTFSRYPLLKNPSLFLFRSPKTNSRKLLLNFSATNYNNEEEEKTKKTKSSKKFGEMEKSLQNTNREWKKIKSASMVYFEIVAKQKSIINDFQVLMEKAITEKELDELEALRDKKLDELTHRKVQAQKIIVNLLENLRKDIELKKTRDESIEKLDMLIGVSADREKELKKSSLSSKVMTPLKEEDNKLALGLWDLYEEVCVFEQDQTIENLKNIEQLCMKMLSNCDNPVLGLLYTRFLEQAKFKMILLEYQDNCSKLLNVSKMESCFEHDTFFITEVSRVRYIWTFTGFLKKPIEEVMPELEKKLSKVTGMDVVVCFKEHEYDQTKKVCTVELKESRDYFLGYNNQSSFSDIPTIVLCIASFGTTALMSSFLLRPNATFDDYLANVVPLFGGLFSILGVSEIATRITAARYGVKLSPSYLIPSIWTGLLGVINDYESPLPNNKALFDIPVARTASAYLMSLVLVITAFVVDGSFNGGNNPMYISPGFFSYNTLLFYIQFVIGPYRDDFANVLPYVVEGVGVPVNPLAFAGILGVAVTSINLLPIRRMEGGRITQALFGHFVAKFMNNSVVMLMLAIGVLDGNVLCLVWFLVSINRYCDETPVKDEITPLGDERYTLGFILQVICVFTLFPNIAGRFPFSVFHSFEEIYNVISSSLSYNS